MTGNGTLATLAVVLAALTAVPALAGERAGASFETLDGDGDGQISRAEMAKRAEARFSNLDRDGDGQLNAPELDAASDRRVEAMLRRFDSDGDGALSQAELPRGRGDGRLFGRIDADGSGGISRVEFATARERMAARRIDRIGRD